MTQAVLQLYMLDGPGFQPQFWRDFPETSRPTREAQLAYCVMGNESLSQGVKRPERGADHPPPSSVGYLYFSSVPAWYVTGSITSIMNICTFNLLYKYYNGYCFLTPHQL